MGDKSHKFLFFLDWKESEVQEKFCDWITSKNSVRFVRLKPSAAYKKFAKLHMSIELHLQ